MKAGPTANDRNVIARMFRQGASPQIISAETKVRIEQVNIVIETVKDGTFKGARDLQQPVTAIAKAQQEADELRAELDALKAEAANAKSAKPRAKAAAAEQTED